MGLTIFFVAGRQSFLRLPAHLQILKVDKLGGPHYFFRVLSRNSHLSRTASFYFCRPHTIYMNRLPIILSSLALLGVVVLGAMQMRSSTPSTPRPASVSGSSSKPTAETNLEGSRIAYVDIDTFEANYESLKAKKAEFDAQKTAMKGELQRSAAQFQADLQATQRKYQEGTLSQAEAAAAEKRLGQMQQTLSAREESMSKQFSDKLDAFNKELHDRMNSFLSEYAEQHGLDYVFSYSTSAPVLMYGKPALNITQDVIKGMNERAKASGDAAKSK